jgi:hypothetical protein
MHKITIIKQVETEINFRLFLKKTINLLSELCILSYNSFQKWLLAVFANIMATAAKTTMTLFTYFKITGYISDKQS